MFYRSLFILLTSVAASGLGSEAIANERLRSEDALLIAQQSAPGESSATQIAQAPASPAIQSLQTRLTELGYYSGTVDGVFGQETRDALAAFQQDNGLAGTGILDPLTQERLSNPQSSGEGGTAGEQRLELPDPEDAPAAEADSETAPELELSLDGEAAAPETADAEATDEAAGEAEATDTAAADGEAAEADANDEAEASPERGGPPLLLLAVLIIALGGAGAGVLYWFLRRKPDADETPTSATVPAIANGMSADTMASSETATTNMRSVKPPPPPPSRYTRNGQPPKTNALSTQPLEAHSQPGAIAPKADSPIAKLNVIDELIEDLTKNDLQVRHKAIWELGQRGNSAAVQPLVNMLLDADSKEQSLILAALSEISSKTLKPMNRAVAIALQDENPEVRKNAIRDLTRLYDSMNQFGRMLGHATADNDPEVRRTANWAINQLNNVRLTATDTAALLKESEDLANPSKRLPGSNKRLPEDGSTSR